MSMSKAHIRATAKYNAKAYDRIEVKVKKGEKATLQAIAAKQGMSLNSFITTAIDYYLLNKCPMSVDKVAADPDDNSEG